MLNLTASRINRSEEMTFDPAATLIAVGCALIQGALGTVKPSAGNSGELFVGAALSQPLTLLSFPKMESIIVPANNIVALFATPLASTLRVALASDNSAITVGTPSGDATKYSISGANVTLRSTLVGATVNFWYQYAPTTIQARTLQGDTQPGGAASLTLGTVGVIKAGTIVTTEYDTLVDWTAANPAVKTGANGRFTIGGSGSVVPNALVMAAPSTTDGMLSLYFSA